jgi:BirA family biotin operon repressor/biotin-[acetyl-CoA-carboxylase] ligase
MTDAPPGWRMQTHETLGSTQDYAIAAAQAGDPGRLAVMARDQTRGRGSRGRQWVGAAGNLHLSALIRPEGWRPNPAFWSLMAGVVFHEAVAGVASDPGSLRLKWPNDLLLGGGKLGGILIDSALSPAGLLDWVVIGFGANLAAVPEGIEAGGGARAIAHLAAAGVSAEALAARILRCLVEWLERPFAEVRDAWLDHAQPIGTILHIEVGCQRRRGAYLGLSEEGDLLISDGPSPVSTAAIFVGLGPQAPVLIKGGGVQGADPPGLA